MKKLLQRIIRPIIPILEKGVAKLEAQSDKRVIRKYHKRKAKAKP